MLKKKTLTETVYNNGDPFQVLEAISACIRAWQKREDVEILWGTLKISPDTDDYSSYWETNDNFAAFDLSVEVVYREGN